MLQQRVEAGIAWLDEHYLSWKKEIDLETLDLAHCHRCILGQLEGIYWRAIERFDLSESDVIALGFENEQPRGYEDLTTAWRNTLAALL